VNLLSFLIFAPYTKKRIGTGIRLTATKPSTDVAHCTPRDLYMYFANMGKAAPTKDRMTVLPAMAELLCIMYTSMIWNCYQHPGAREARAPINLRS